MDASAMAKRRRKARSSGGASRCRPRSSIAIHAGAAPSRSAEKDAGTHWRCRVSRTIAQRSFRSAHFRIRGIREPSESTASPRTTSAPDQPHSASVNSRVSTRQTSPRPNASAKPCAASIQLDSRSTGAPPLHSNAGGKIPPRPASLPRKRAAKATPAAPALLLICGFTIRAGTSTFRRIVHHARHAASLPRKRASACQTIPGRAREGRNPSRHFFILTTALMHFPERESS